MIILICNLHYTALIKFSFCFQQIVSCVSDVWGQVVSEEQAEEYKHGVTIVEVYTALRELLTSYRSPCDSTSIPGHS